MTTAQAKQGKYLSDSINKIRMAIQYNGPNEIIETYLSFCNYDEMQKVSAYCEVLLVEKLREMEKQLESL